jgi:hypothetical protein
MGKELSILMNAPMLTSRLTAAVEDQTSGATGVVRQVIDGLSELVAEPERLRATAGIVAAELPWCAPMWHVVRAANAPDPAVALNLLREKTEFDVDRSVAVTVKLLTERGGTVRTAPGSALVGAVLDALPRQSRSDAAVTGLVGADALGPGAVLNVAGTADLARTVPTIVVMTSLKLVPAEVFQRLGADGFERIDLPLFEAVVLDGEVLTPAEAGCRAAALR